MLCPFCSFHRVEFREDRASAYFKALRAEIRLVSELGYRFSEVYVGGGTPTVLPDELAKTLTLVRDLHPVGAMSAETNPLDLDVDTMKDLQSAGLTRLSVGVQSFDDGLLREMERYDKYGSGDQVRAHRQPASPGRARPPSQAYIARRHQRLAVAADLGPLAGVRRVVFLGDSITYSGQYVEFIEARYCSR